MTAGRNKRTHRDSLWGDDVAVVGLGRLVRLGRWVSSIGYSMRHNGYSMSHSGRYKILFITIAGALALLSFIFQDQLWEAITRYYHLFASREQIKSFISSCGLGAPVVFIVLQVLQVIFAPIPGEATGFIGGYLFGTVLGFLYSSIGLTAGSWINFSIGRFFGSRYVRRWIPDEQFDRFDTVIRRQGVIVLFILFVFPGFPKDFLCLFLGLSTLPLKVFILLSAVGRMPGTLMLSMQGAFLYEKMYGWFALLLSLCLVAAFFGYRYREDIYSWIERVNSR